MCGIFGIINGNIENNQDKIQKMSHSLRHRGPDDNRLHTFNNCILGHTRLSIIDPINGQQPMIMI